MYVFEENVICSRPSTCTVTENNGSIQLPRHRQSRQSIWFPLALAIIIMTTIVLIMPVWQETDIHIQIGYADNIMDVWVNTPSKPLISRLLPPSYSLGTYTLNVTIALSGQNILNFSRVNVPVTEYVIVWQNTIPAKGVYTITVELYKLQSLKDTFTVTISF